MKLSIAQKFIQFFSAASLFEKMKEDSRRYRFTCNCGKESSIWDIGGIRYKAAGKSTTGVKCPHCGKFAMRKIYKVD